MKQIFRCSVSRLRGSTLNKKLILVLFLVLLTANLLSSRGNSAAELLQVRVNRWLEVRQLSGMVTFYRGGTSQRAQVGTRLESMGDAIGTGNRSSAVLEVDTGIGMVDVSSNTTVRVRALEVTADGGRLTRLQVNRGQVRLKVRPFTRPNSGLEIETPAGVSAVRGTNFGLIVHSDGWTGVATLEGGVLNISQGQTVLVKAGFQGLMIPGEPPLQAVPLTDEPYLKLQLLTALKEQMARIVARVDPVNLVMIGDSPLVTDRNGQFDIAVPLPLDRRIKVVVTTPLGKQQVYELAVP
jgi:hypothetical protein